MIGTPAQDALITRSVIALVTTLRADGSPTNSMVSFARRGDQLYFTTTLDRVKGRILAHDPRVGLVILNPHEPWSFVSVEGRVTIHRDNPEELRELILSLTEHVDFPWEGDAVNKMITGPGRAMFQVTVDRVSGAVF